MGQANIYELLKKQSKKTSVWFTSLQIGEFLGIGRGSAITCLQKLTKAKLIQRREKKIHNGRGYEYRFK